MRASPPGLGALLAAALLAAPAGAATVYVGQDGTDGPSCGAKASPCRSISRGVDVAGAGDTIRVGPGRYGDLNNDGSFDDPGDEAAEVGSGCFCVIHVDKQVTLLSEAGAGATVIDGNGTVGVTLVAIVADRAVFGRANQGFTVERNGGDLAGAAIAVVAEDVTIAGNTAAENVGTGFHIVGAHVLSDNRARDNLTGFRIIGGSSLTRNLAVSNVYGMQIEGQGAELKDDVVAANHSLGVAVMGGATDVVLTRVQVVGNGNEGIQVNAPIAVRGGRIVGNDGEGMNCGVYVSAGGALDAEGVYWGSATGPGDDPADIVCAEVGTTVDTDPPGKKPGKLRLKPLK